MGSIEQYIELLKYLAAAVGGSGLGAAATYVLERHKVHAEASQLEAKTEQIQAQSILDLWTQIGRLHTEMLQLRREVARLEGENLKLRTTIEVQAEKIAALQTKVSSYEIAMRSAGVQP